MKKHYLIASTGILLGSLTIAQATQIGFGQLGGNNVNLPSSLGSNATVDGLGYVVSIGGATPNISLTWDSNWDIHTSSYFDPLENQTVGGGAWDNEGGVARIGQLDLGFHTIRFSVDPGYALLLSSFDFGHTAETAGTTKWTLSLTDSSATTVWQQLVVFEGGQVHTITPNFAGELGESYTLNFFRTEQSYGSDGRHGIDNLTFSQIVPEPSVAAMTGIAWLGFLVRRRK